MIINECLQMFCITKHISKHRSVACLAKNVFYLFVQVVEPIDDSLLGVRAHKSV